jgi:hypothetical protein
LKRLQENENNEQEQNDDEQEVDIFTVMILVCFFDQFYLHDFSLSHMDIIDFFLINDIYSHAFIHFEKEKYFYFIIIYFL